MLLFLLINIVFSKEYGEYLGNHMYLTSSINDINTYSIVYRIPGYKEKEPIKRRLFHTWGDFYWEKNNGDKLNLTIGDCSTTSSLNWSSMLYDVIHHWNNVPEFQNGQGRIFKPKNASMFKTTCGNAMVNFYNAQPGSEEYTNDGTLGVAKMSARGNKIIRINCYVNEFYLNNYNQQQWIHVLCHEIGHSWPLGHPDTNGNDLNTCMDYSRYLDNKYGNYHDIQIIDYLYANGSNSTNKPTGYPKDDEEWYENDLVKIFIIFFLIFFTISFLSCSIGFIYYVLCCGCKSSRNEREPGSIV